MSPQLALRVTVIGGIALVLFGLVFFRLWYLQVLEPTHYQAEAASNVYRTIAVPAVRGSFLGLDDQPLVRSVTAPAVTINPMELPVQLSLPSITSSDTYQSGKLSGTPKRMLAQPAADMAIYARLAPILGMSDTPRNCTVTVYYTGKVVTFSAKQGNAPLMTPIECAVAKGVAQSQYTNVTIKQGVSVDVRAYIDERQAQFEGVIAGVSSQRQYLLGEAGAQLFGYVGPIQADEVNTANYKTASNADEVGQAGLEAQYDKWLLGSDGYQKVKVDSQGEFEGYGASSAGQAGDNVQLSIDPALEKVGQASLQKSILANQYGGTEGQADAGAFVAMNPQNGQIYAMGSAPSYQPSIFAHGLSEKEWEYLNNPANHYPLDNNAIQGEGPDGSTFKVVTSTAAMESGIWSPDATWDDPGKYCIPGIDPNSPGACRHDSSGESGGEFNLATAMEVSDDDFFFHLGYLMYKPDGGALQKWEGLFGVGQSTGVDLPGEASGELAGPALVKQLYKEEIECQNATGPYKGHPKHPGGCGIASTGTWGVGDNLNTALGQGDIQVTPMQLAVVYAAIENGGTIVTPHLGEDIQSQSGTVLQKIDPAPKRHLNINPVYLQTIQHGLYLAANGSSGTSSDVMQNFGKPVYGKTGTAQYGTTTETNAGGGSDWAWYACYVPASATSKPIVVIVWVQKGGFGDVAAAPVARQILSQWFYGHPGPYVSGKSTDA